jgi:hypothetical protein
VSDWRHAVRWRIDGPQLRYDGIGELSSLHATAYQVPTNEGKRAWLVSVIEEFFGDKAVEYVYGETLPLTRKMAVEVAERFVTGKKIPKRLEWR